MAKHNNNTNTNANVNTNEENVMKDPIQALIDAQREKQKNKDWKLSEIAKIKKEMNKELDIIDNACREATKNLTNDIERKQIELAFEAKKLEVKQQFQPKIERLKVDLETISEAVSTVAGEKIGAFVAPATKGVKGFWDSFKSRAGLDK